MSGFSKQDIAQFIHSQKHENCNKSVDILLSSNRYQDGFAWLGTTCCWQVCCKFSTDMMRVECQNLLSIGLLQVGTSLQMTSCNKPDFNRLVATWWNWQVCCNLLTSCNNPIKLTTGESRCPGFWRLYPRRRERLTIYWCQCKGSPFSFSGGSRALIEGLHIHIFRLFLTNFFWNQPYFKRN